MFAARSMWRAFAAGLQIVALVALLLPSLGHVHVGSGDLHHAVAVGMELVSGDPDGGSTGRLDDRFLEAGDHLPDKQEPSVGDGRCSCGCQSVLMGTVGQVALLCPGRSFALPVRADRNLSTLAPEALPEPPRSLA